jgi:hypothetical protein
MYDKKQAKTLAFLESKHKSLHEKVEVLEAEKAPDKFITALKKEKLLVKDELETLRKQIEQNAET